MLVTLVPLNPSEFELIIFTPVPVTPFAEVVKVLADEALLKLPITLDVAATPFTVEVSVLPVMLNVFVEAALIADVKFRAVDATPLTVVVKLVPLNEVVLLLTKGTVVLETPLIVVLKVFADEVLLTLVIAMVVSVIPFMLLVKIFPETLKEFVLINGADVPATPLMVEFKLLPDDVLATVFTAFAVAATPFTVEVKVLADELIVCVVPALIAGAKFKAVDATPFTVVVKLVPLNEVALELMMFTPPPVTPFIVVVNVFVDEVLETVFIVGAVATVPLNVEVRILPEEDNALVLVKLFEPAMVF